MEINKNLKPVSLKKVKLNNGLLADKNVLAREKVIPYQWKALNDELPDTAPSHAIENFEIAAGRKDGEYYGMVFQDSDVAKWLEAVGYSLATNPDPELEKTADEVIDIIAEAQQDDGYLNTHFTVAKPDQRWSNLRDWHELYCAGHLMEAAVAYYQATGKKKIVDVMSRYADYIDEIFGSESDKKKGYPGHEEIELALVKLYRVTGNEKYLKLSKFFIDERGQKPHYFDIEAEERGDEKEYWNLFGYKYNQSHLPVREQDTAEGHSVRAVYLYSGMADVAMETGDESLVEACKTLWDNVTQKRMYVTGGIGSSGYGEAFTFDYDLPNDTAYTETCAAIGLVFWAHRMFHLDPDSRYIDVMEKAIYNGVLSGISLDGEKFFYVNPLEVWPEATEKRHDEKHVKPTRQKWFGCACCPPNIARLMASIGGYIYSTDDSSAYVHLYGDSSTDFEVNGAKVNLTQKTNYPWDENVEIVVSPEQEAEFTLALRIPGWCRDTEIKVNGETVEVKEEKGYAKITRKWNQDDKVELILTMPVERVYSNPEVRENVGKVALQRGPVVYCLEEVDNGENLSAIVLPVDSELTAEYKADLLGGVIVLKGEAERLETPEGKLYSTEGYTKKSTEITAIPYFVWDNREPGEMTVWIREK